MKNRTIYPLLEKAFSKSDISIAREVISKQQLTMSNITKKFEKEDTRKTSEILNQNTSLYVFN